jgi:transposase
LWHGFNFAINNYWETSVYIDFKKGSTFVDPDATTDSAKMYKAYDTVQKTWQHLNFFEYECHLHARVPRIKRDDGKVRLVPTPWEGKVLGFTLLFEALLIQLCKAMPVHNVSQLTGVSDHKVWRVLDTYIALAKKDEDFSDLSTIGMDEPRKIS